MEALLSNKSRVILLSGSRTRAKRLAEDLRDYGLSSFYTEDMEREVQPEEVMTMYGHPPRLFRASINSASTAVPFSIRRGGSSR